MTTSIKVAKTFNSHLALVTKSIIVLNGLAYQSILINYKELLVICPKDSSILNPNLGGGGLILPPCWFSLNSSEMVKGVTLAFFNI